MAKPIVLTVAGASMCALAPLAFWERFAPAGGGTWALVATSATCLLLFLAFRLRTGLDSPGLVAAVVFGAFPATLDAVASPHAGGLLAAALGSAVLLLGAARLAWRPAFPVLAVLSIAAGLLLPGGERSFGAGAFLPPVLLGVGAAILAGVTAVEAKAAPPSVARWILHFLVFGPLPLSVLLTSLRREECWESPRAFWERAVEERPDALAPLGALARAEAEAGDVAAAAARLRRFAEIAERGAGPGPGERRIAVEGVAGAVRALVRRPDSDREALEAAMVAALRMEPGAAPLLLARGEERLEAGDFPGALAALDRAAAAEPDSAAAQDALARALLQAGRIDEALAAAGRASGLAPGRADYSRTLAAALLALDRGPEALRLLKQGLGSPPYDPEQARAFADAHGRLARKEISAGNRGRARRFLWAAREVLPSHGPTLELLAPLDAAAEEERPQFAALAKPGPDGSVDPNGLQLYAVWLCRWGEFERAEPLFRTLELQVGGLGAAAVHYHLAREFWEARGTVEGNEKAVLSYRDALARDPDYAEARNGLWQALRRLGRIPEALEEARRFLAAAPAHPDSVDAERFLAGGVAER